MRQVAKADAPYQIDILGGIPEVEHKISVQ